MTIEPDTKDWTWVLSRPCPDCGLEAGRVAVPEVGAMVRANARAWQDVLARSDVAVRTSEDVWSPLEYACHVRDSFRRFDERLASMLMSDDPLFPNWDQDATAIEDDYAAQDPAVVAVELQAAGDGIADAFDALEESQYGRPGRRSDGAAFTVESFARYFVHDPVHHLHDVSSPRG